MNKAVLHIFPGQEGPGDRLGHELGCETQLVHVHRFPDGESLVRVATGAGTALVYCSLDDPNTKLIQLLLTASALRDNGVSRLVLICPYLCYMRQDTAFRPGQAVSQRVIGRFLAGAFDRVVTVDPHLHRTSHLSDVFPGIDADALSAAPAIASALRNDAVASETLIVGPDIESRPWVEAVAGPLGLEAIVGTKTRGTDRLVDISFAEGAAVRGRPAIIVDDIVSSGGTVKRCALELLALGATSVELVAVHALGSQQDMALINCSGVSRIRSTDSIPHPTNAIALATLIAGAVRSEL